MALEEIIQEIDRRGKEELQSLSEHYEARTREIQEKYKAMEKELREEWEKKVHSEVDSLKKNLISSSQMESLRLIRGREKELVDSAMEKIEDHLSEVRRWKNYPKIMHSLHDMALKSLGKDCRIIVAKSDRDILQGSETENSDQVLENYGGLVAFSKDGSMELDLKIFSIYEELRERIISSISERIGE